MKRVKFTKSEELKGTLLKNVNNAVKDIFDDISTYIINPAYTLGTISDFFRVVEILSEDKDIVTGKKPTKKERRDSVVEVEEKGGHSGHTWGYIMMMIKKHYPEGWEIIKKDWN